MKIKKGLSMGIFSVVAAAIGFILSFSQIASSLGLSDISLSAQTYPRFAAILLFLFGLGNIVKSLVFKSDEEITLDLKNELKVVLIFAVSILYLIVFEYIGFILSTSLLSCFFLVLQKCKKKNYYYICIATTIIVFIAFKYGLGVTKLPWGFPLNMIFG